MAAIINFLEGFMATNCTKVSKHGWVNCATPQLSLARNEPFKQIFDEYPNLVSFYTPFERSYDSEYIFDLMVANNYTIPCLCIIGYLLFIYFGPIYFKDKKPLKLETPLAYWNLLMSLFSLWGAVRLVPHTLWLMSSKTFEETLCQPVHTMAGGGAAGLALQLFVLSKIPELLDTAFIILRKKPLIFLHWYHHITVLIFCWDGYVTEASMGHYFASMNLIVHSMMYFYFYMQAIKAVPKWFPSYIITVVQIQQMIVGTFIMCACIYYHFYGGSKFAPGQCNKMSNLIVGAIIYSSYLYLFIAFAVQRFVYGESVESIKKKM